MSKWSGSEYNGPKDHNWEQGEGKFTFPNGVIYHGNMDKGEFHGDGTLIYTNGGKYVAKWDRGKLIEGKYFFYDDLEFKDKEWPYSQTNDRRFYTEAVKNSMRPGGKTLFVNSEKGPMRIPEGTYDVGDGYYDPAKRIICDYNGEEKREVTVQEEQWIVDKCTYEARKFENDTHLDGSQDKIVKEMIQLNQNPELLEMRKKGTNKKKDAAPKTEEKAE